MNSACYRRRGSRRSRLGCRATLSLTAPGMAMLFLVACAMAPVYRLPDVMGKVRNDLGLTNTSILDQERCRVGQAFVGAPSVTLSDCIFVETNSQAIVITYDQYSARYKALITINAQSQGIALKLHRSLFDNLEQIQVRNDAGYLILQFDDSALGTRDDLAATTRAYEYLKRLGVPRNSGRKFVPEATGPGTIYIPVYVPAR
jgi:hypothetical protein